MSKACFPLSNPIDHAYWFTQFDWNVIIVKEYFISKAELGLASLLQISSAEHRYWIGNQICVKAPGYGWKQSVMKPNSVSCNASNKAYLIYGPIYYMIVILKIYLDPYNSHCIAYFISHLHLLCSQNESSINFACPHEPVWGSKLKGLLCSKNKKEQYQSAHKNFIFIFWQ